MKINLLNLIFYGYCLQNLQFSLYSLRSIESPRLSPESRKEELLEEEEVAVAAPKEVSMSLKEKKRR